MKIALFANTDWYLYNFCSALALELKNGGYQVILLSPPGDYCARILELGFDWREAPVSRKGLNPFTEVATIAWLIKFVHENKIDILHGFTIKCSIYGSIASRILRKQMAVNTISGLGFTFSSETAFARILRPFIKLLMRFSLGWSNSKTIVLNSDDYKWFLDNNITNKQNLILLLGAGIDCRKFDRFVEKNVVDGCLRVLMASRLLQDKGVYEYIESARSMIGRGFNVKFLLAGMPDKGNPASITLEEVEDWAQQGIIDWLGHVEDMPELLNSVDIFILPSYREGLPTGLTEAASCQLALIATDVPGCRDVIDHNVNGLLVPPRNSLLLTDAIERLYFNDCERAEFGKAARDKAIKCFEKSVINTATLGIYNRLDLESSSSC